MMKKRTMTLVLVMLLLLSSCSGQTSDETTDNVTENQESETVPETELHDALPERNYGGASYVILSASEQWKDTYVAEENTGDVLNDGVYARNMAIEERFGVVLQYEVVPGYSSGQSTVTSKLRGSVQAGDAAYDLMTANCAYTASYITGGLLQNMTKMEYLDFDALWYYKETNNTLIVNDKLYVVAGTFGLNTLGQLGAVIFNKEMMDDLGEEYPYQTVLDGKWTYDTMLSIAAKASMDLNGDGKMDKNDRFGILSTMDEAIQWLGFGMGYRIVQQDEEGKHSFIGATEKNIDILDTLSELMENKSVYHATAITDPLDEMIPMFVGGNGLFAIYGLGLMNYEEMRKGSDFGVLPMPKWDADQDMYYSKCFVEVSAFPMVLKDADMSQVVLEGLNSTSYIDLLPIYYDVVLQRKLVRDNDSAAMIDLIREGTICDFGMAYHSSLDGALFGIDIIIRDGSFATWWASNEQSLEKKLETLLEDLSTLDSAE